MFSKEYHQIKERMVSRAIAGDVIYSLNIAGFWVKDMEFKFLDISEVASNILYGMKSNDCIGKTDFDIANELGCKMDKEMFAEVCRGSDLYTLDNPIGDSYYSYTFIEMITDTKGNKHIWQVVKGIQPPKVGEGKYFYGFARFMDVITGSYENALKWLEKEMPHLTKLNDNLYLYNNYTNG